MSICVEKSDIDTLVALHQGNKTYRAVLESIDSEVALFKVLANYIAFNATFGAGVANLAGEIGVRQDLFRDKSDPISALADRSMEIGSDIIAAAVDEFDDRSTEHRDTHRSLASATLKAAAEYFKFDNEQLNQLATPSSTTKQAEPEVHAGYGVNRSLGEQELFQCLGFHMSSEILADEEFGLLDGFLKKQYPELVGYLESKTVLINDEHHNAYWWIRIHTSVEADDFAFAVRGANSALKYYTGSADLGTCKGWILDGFRKFADVQTHFMDGLRSL